MFNEFKFDKTRFENGNDKKMIKLVFLGHANSGKTAIINQFINNHFLKEYIKTTDAIIYKKKYNLNLFKGEIEDIYYIEILDTMDILNEEDGNKEFFQELLKEREVSTVTDKFKQRNGQILKYEYFNEKIKKLDENNQEHHDTIRDLNEVKSKYANIDMSNFGLFSIVPVMAYIHVFDCGLDLKLNKNKFEKIVLYAQSIRKELDANFDNNERKKPLQFFVANKYPFYIDPELLNIKETNKLYLNRIDKNVNDFRDFFSGAELLKQDMSNFFVLNAENTKLVHKLFEKILSVINSMPELLDLKRQVDDEVQAIETEGNLNANKGFFPFLCCSGRKKKKNKEIDDNQDENELNDTNQGIDEDNEINIVDEHVNQKSKIVGGKLTKADDRLKTNDLNRAQEKDIENQTLEQNNKKGCLTF